MTRPEQAPWDNSMEYDRVNSIGAILDNYEYELSVKQATRPRISTTSRFFQVALLLLFLHCIQLTSGDYEAGYLEKVIRSRGGSACEGEYLRIQCPLMTTIAIQGAMYGRKVPSNEMCPSRHASLRTPAALLAEDINCEATTSLVKTARECENRRVCQLLVYPRVFGGDPCPNTTKYLTVTYKCRLMRNELRSSNSCISSPLKLRCSRPKTIIAVYNVSVEKQSACEDEKEKNCSMTSEEALNYVTNRCHKRHKCSVPITSSSCGNFASVQYGCVPRHILTNHLPSPALANVSSPNTSDDVIEASSAITSPPDESFPDDPVIPKIVSVHPSIMTTLLPSATQGTTGLPNTTIHETTTLVITLPAVQDSATSLPVTSSYRPPVTTIIIATSSPQWKDTKEVDEDILIDTDIETTVIPVQFHLNVTHITTAFNTTAASNTSSNNSTLSPELAFLYSLVQFFSYLREHTDRVLVVVFASISLSLFLTVIMLLCHNEKRIKENEKNARVNEAGTEAERETLMGNSRRPQADSSSSGTRNLFSSAPQPNTDHSEYISRVQERHRRRKKRSKTQLFLNKWCSCCCSNAPWQRDISDSEDSYHNAPRSTSMSDDDVISAVVVNRREQFEGPLPVFPPTAEMDNDGRYNARSQGTASELRYADDNISQYEFQDNDPLTPGGAAESSSPARPSTLQTSQRSVSAYNQRNFASSTFAIRDNAPHCAYQYNPPQVSPLLTKQSRSPPPFPKPVTYSSEARTHAIPHHPSKRCSYQPQQSQTSQQFNSDFIRSRQDSAQQRHHPSYVPNYEGHGVVLRQQQPSNGRTLMQNQSSERLEQRESFYDNSIPRNSPIYEYYLRQQGRQELPGTRNINQYYS